MQAATAVAARGNDFMKILLDVMANPYGLAHL
jgi:hypothetical protein